MPSWGTAAICVYQDQPVRGDVKKNVETVCEVIAESRNKHNDLVTNAAEHANSEQPVLVLFAELFLSGYDIGKDLLHQVAIGVDSSEMKQIALACKEHKVAVIIPYVELADNKTYYNSAAVFNFEGKLLHNYRKVHLWACYEDTIFTAGSAEENFKVFELVPGGPRIGVLICYDIEFPEAARVLFLQKLDILCVPTALA